MSFRSSRCTAAALALALLPGVAQAETPAEMLEKGIYAENTVGDLDEAIKIYRKVVSDARETKLVAAQAQYRLGECLSKQGNQEESRAAFQALIKGYSGDEVSEEIRAIVAKATKRLALKLAAPPWKDGERLTLTMRLPGGDPIGIFGLGIDAGWIGGDKVWRMLIRRFITGGQTQGVSRVVVDAASNRPRDTIWDHTALGTTSANWEENKLTVMTKGADGKNDTKTIDLEGTVFSNDQVFYVFRQLPLAVGFKTTIPIRVAFTGGNAIGLEINVPKTEMINTPAGPFEAFRLETNIDQTFWVATDPHRYIVRFDLGGIVTELSSIEHAGSKELLNTELGLAVTIPKNWFYYAWKTGNSATSGGFNLVAPDMAHASLHMRKKSMLDAAERESLRAWAESRIKIAKEHLEGLTLRSDSMKEAQMAGLPSIGMTLDLELSGRKNVARMNLATNNTWAIDFATSAEEGQVEAYDEQFDRMLKSISLR
jgi:hypothetical protein